MDQYDVAIIGGGPGGYVAAIRAAQVGFKVVLIEKQHLGGICLNWGCIPTKALLHAAAVYQTAKQSVRFGVTCTSVKADIKQIVAYSRSIADKLREGVQHLLRKNGVKVIEGTGKLLAKNQITVIENNGKIEESPNQTVTAKHIIIATGANPKTLPGFVIDHELIWNYKDALVPSVLPNKLLIIGGGVIGVECATLYHKLGTNVTIVEAADRILPSEDEEISSFAHNAFIKQGINIHTSVKVDLINKTKGGVEVEIRDTASRGTTRCRFDNILSSVGILPNTEGLGLETTKVQFLSNGHIKTDIYARTDERGIYAIGDVAGSPALAHKASHEAMLCIEKIAAINTHPLNIRNIPRCVYSDPQIASVGYTEQEARAHGFDIKVGKFPYIGNGKALILLETDGFVKTIFDTNTGELLGAHMLGSGVAEMIQGYTITKQMEGTEEDLMHTVFPHPTLSEAMQESVFAAYKRAIHM